MLKIGLSVANYGELPSREFLLNVARESEKQGLDSLWTSDHIIVPKDHHPWTRIFETITTLSFISSVTTKILLGTSVILLPLRDPIILAKQIATINTLSNGRVIIGVGIGWNNKEFELIGKNFQSRMKTVGDQIQTMRKFWKDGFRNIGFTSEPLPTEETCPRILVGGQSIGALRRVAEFGDGWHPVGITPQEYAQGKKEIIAIKNQKYIWSLRLGFTANKNFLDSEYIGTDGKKRVRLVGNREQIISDIEKYKKSGLDHLILDIRDVTSIEYMEQIQLIGEIQKYFS